MNFMEIVRTGLSLAVPLYHVIRNPDDLAAKEAAKAATDAFVVKERARIDAKRKKKHTPKSKEA